MTADELQDKWSDLQFDVRRSIRYHQRRRGFFDRLDMGGNMLSVMFGSTAIYGILDTNSKPLALIASALVTAIAAINLVIGSAQKARLHADLARRFVELERQLLVDPTKELLRQMTSQRLSIESEEPPVLRVLDSLCYNEQLRAKDRFGYIVGPITRWQRFFAQWLDIYPERIERRSTSKADTLSGQH